MYLRLFLIFFAMVELFSAEAVDSILARYERPFTFLGIGEGIEAFMGKNTLAYPKSVFVQLAKQIDLPASSRNVIGLKYSPSLQDIEKLSSCEHVDVLLLLDPLSLFEKNWRQALQMLQQMSHVLVVAWPKSSFEGHFSTAYTEDGAFLYFVLEGKEPFPLRKTTFVHPRKIRWSYEIYCDYHRKYLKKIRPNWSAMQEWFPGINMMTYLMFNGCIPSRPQVVEHLPKDFEHSDWVANNMIMQGEKIILIDKDDPVSTPVDPADKERFPRLEANLRKFILSTVDMTPQQVRSAFISIYNWGNYFDKEEIDE